MMSHMKGAGNRGPLLQGLFIQRFAANETRHNSIVEENPSRRGQEPQFNLEPMMPVTRSVIASERGSAFDVSHLHSWRGALTIVVASWIV